MSRQQKELVIETLKKGFEKNPASFLVGYKGLSVAQMQELRTKLREKGGKLKVAKARLMKIAAEKLPQADMLIPYLHDQVGLVFASEEPPSVAKVLKEFSKDNEALTLIVGSFEKQLLTSELIEKFATLPSREVLLAQLCATLKGPLTKLVRTLNAVPLKLIWTLQNISESKK